MDYITWQLVALGALILGIGLTAALLLPEKKKEIYREEIKMQKKLYLVPLDETSRGLADWIGSKLSGRMKFKISSGMTSKLPEESFNSQRGGYFSSVVLNKLQFNKASDDEFILAVTDEDLFTPTTDFVFSGSDQLAGVAIVSTQRLRPEFYGLPADSEILRIRALKIAVHEIGHLLGLESCNDTNCVMFASTKISEVDFQSDRFCQRCMLELSMPAKVPRT
jgi:archaemetzincin